MGIIMCRSCWMGRNPTGALNQIDLPDPYFNYRFLSWEFVDAPDLADSKHPGPAFWLCPDCITGRIIPRHNKQTCNDVVRNH